MKLLLAFLLIALASPQALGADCDRVRAANLNTSIRANFTELHGLGVADASVQDRIETLRREFANASDRHGDAFETDDPTDLNDACKLYEAILAEQEDLDLPR